MKKTEVYCIRSGIRILDAIRINVGPLVVMLIAEEEAISQFLGDSEDPSHKNWKFGSETFEGKYENGKELLKFITDSPSNVIELLRKTTEGRDDSLLKDIFFIEVESRNKEEEGPPLPPVEINSHPAIFNISKISGGFSVSFNKAGMTNNLKFAGFPIECKVEVAYNVRRGNPLIKFDPRDFNLKSSDIYKEESEGGKIVKLEDNTIVVRFDNESYQISVNGFDIKRNFRSQIFKPVVS